MNGFKYRIKRYRDEGGEYSAYNFGDIWSIRKIIDSHWTNENCPNDLEVISILNLSGQSLLLEHQKKQVFDAYFLPLNNRFHFHKKSRIDIVYQCLELFMTNQVSEIETLLNKTKKENTYIRGDFFFKDHDYRITNKRKFRELIWFFWCGLPLGGMLTILSGKLFLDMSLEHFLIPLFVLALGTYFWLPGILLHIQYTKDFKDLVVRITRGSELITIRAAKKTKTLDKSKIAAVTKFQNPAYKNPWANYGFTEIVFTTGDVINLTNLTVDQLFILDKFPVNTNIKIGTANKMFPFLKNKSAII